MNDALRQGISRHLSEGELNEIARAEGLWPLWEDGREKVLLGETSCAELLRVLG